MSPIRALIVDDKWLIRSELKYMLKPYLNIEIIGEAENGREAADLIQQKRPDVIFLDIHLPDDSGFDLVERLKPDCQIVFISAYNTDNNISLCEYTYRKVFFSANDK